MQAGRSLYSVEITPTAAATMRMPTGAAVHRAARLVRFGAGGRTRTADRRADAPPALRHRRRAYGRYGLRETAALCRDRVPQSADRAHLVRPSASRDRPPLRKERASALISTVQTAVGLSPVWRARAPKRCRLSKSEPSGCLVALLAGGGASDRRIAGQVPEARVWR